MMTKEMIQLLTSANTSDAERNLLESMRKELLPLCTYRAGESEEDLFEKEFLTYAKATFDDDNPFPNKSPETLFPSTTDLNQFTCYIFERRYGWSEAGKDGGMRRVRRLSSGGHLPSADARLKAIINDTLDDFIKWYLHQPLSVALLQAFLYTLSKVSQAPVVRNQTLVHIMDWLKRRPAEISARDGVFDLVKNVVLSGLTDIWSAIRSACSSKLGAVCSELALDQLQDLFIQLTQICENSNSAWQSVEGSVMGLNAVIKGFNWKDQDGEKEKLTFQNCSSSSKQDDLKSNGILIYVSAQIKTVIYPLLCHPQLTIREQATKVLASYLTRCDFQESLASFELVIEKLCEGTRLTGNRCFDQGIVHQAVMRPDYKFLDAYAAEGLLGVCVLLVKRIPVGYLLPKWPSYMSTFMLYLMHPASTVRQATSSIFKYLVSKGSTNPVFVKLVLSELSKDWSAESTTVSQSNDILTASNPPIRPSVTNVHKSSQLHLSDTWEWREGRLFAYELIFKFLIKNHWLYTFGPANPTSEKLSNIGPPSREKMGRRISEAAVSSQPADGESINKDMEPQSEGLNTQHKNRVMTCDSTVLDCIAQPSLSHSRPYSARSRHHDTTQACKSPVGMTSVLHQIIAFEQALTQEDGPYPISKAMDKQRSVLLDSVRHREDSTGPAIPEWLSELMLGSMFSLLVGVYYQITQCVVDDQWELRRMGQQTLPCFSEVLRWYDIDLLLSLWKSHLVPQSTPLSYCTVLTLRDSLSHTAGLQQLLKNPPSVWQDEECCKEVISKISRPIQQNLESYIPIVEQLFNKGSYDKLSVISANVLMLSSGHFHISAPQRVCVVKNVVQFWKRLFCLAHPHVKFVAELTSGRDPPLLQSPFEGYLSCCLVKPEGHLQCARQVERYFVTESHSALLPFVRSLSNQDCSLLLPILTHSIWVFAGDSITCKIMVDSLSHLSSMTVEEIVKEDLAWRKDSIRFVYITLRELASQVTAKNLDLQLVRCLLDIYLVLSKPIVLSKHLSVILTAICARVTQASIFHVEISPRPTDDLAILSNDIPPSCNSDVESDTSDAEEIGCPQRRFPELFTLNASNNSGSFTSGRLSALSTQSSVFSDGRVMSPTSVQSEQEQSISDWDSWSDEEEDSTFQKRFPIQDSWSDEDEDQSAIMNVFSDFLHKLQTQSPGKQREFQTEVKKLGEGDRRLIESILDS